jgi:hypothetical protein
MAEKGDVELLGHVMLAVDLGIAGQREPSGRLDPRGAEPRGAVALGGEDEIAEGGALHARGEIPVSIDRPVGARVKRLGQPVLGVVVDAEVQIEAIDWDGLGLVGLKMDDLDQPGQCPADVDARRIGPEPVIKDQGDSADGHGRCDPSGV